SSGRALERAVADRRQHVRAQDHGAFSRGKDTTERTLSRPARAAPLSQRRGALHRLQTVRSGLSGTGDHHRIGTARRWHAAHHALRYRPHQVHFLRLLRGELPGRLDRRDPHTRIPRRETRRLDLYQGNAAGGRRPLRSTDRRRSGRGRAISMNAQTIVFYAFAAILVFAALRVITSHNPVHSALWLVLSFFSAAGIW